MSEKCETVKHKCSSMICNYKPHGNSMDTAALTSNRPLDSLLSKKAWLTGVVKVETTSSPLATSRLIVIKLMKNK